GLMWGFQLWVNLPARDKMTAPRYQDIPPERVPTVALADGVSARVLVGEAGGVSGPVAGIATQPLYLDVTMAPRSRLSPGPPARDKLTAPRYQDIPPERVPTVALADGVSARVLVGEAGGVSGPVAGIATQPLYLDVTMAPRSRLSHELPAGHSTFAYVFNGRARFGPLEDSTVVATGQLAVLGDGELLNVATGDAAARFLLLAARPLREPIARYGPFVMNTREEILKAVEDYQRGTLLG